jgi:hypothetical protein
VRQWYEAVAWIFGNGTGDRPFSDIADAMRSSRENMMTSKIGRYYASEAAINPEMVTQAKRLFDTGGTLSQSAAKLYTMFGPNIRDLATVLAAVWGADLGFCTSELNVKKLSTTLVNASNGAWLKPDCDRVANDTCSVWHGLTNRKSLSDNGALPYPSTNVLQSPDIICNGGAEANDAQRAQWTTPASWQTAPWTAVVNKNNYFYVRGKNMFPGTLGGRITFYQYRANLGYSPSKWVLVKTDSGSPFAMVNSNSESGLYINDDPFVFNPGSAAGEHLCLVAMISTDYLPNPLPSDNNFNYTSWLRFDLASAWHNIDVPKTTALTASSLSKAETNTLAINNMNDEPETFRFEAHCSDVPFGTILQLTSADLGLDSGLVHISTNNAIVTATAVLPGKYEGDLTVVIKTEDGKPLPPDAVIEVSNFWVVENGHNDFRAAAAHCLQAGQSIDADGTVSLLMGSFTYVGGFQ